MNVQNEPVAVNGAIALILTLLAPVLARYGIDQEGAQQIVALAGSVVAGAVAIWRIVKARSKVSPVPKPPVQLTRPPFTPE